MNRKDVINVLKMENDLITFDPMTGEEIDVKCLNELNKKCYIAHEEAIEFLKQSIPIEWIREYICDLEVVISSMRKSHFPNEQAIYNRQFRVFQIKSLLEDWEKENETNRQR